MKGRRVTHMPELPGDYYGPVMGYTGELPAVFYIKPNAIRTHYVVSPPHRFTEEADGSLTITDSIGDTAGPGSVSDGWHGYLTRGEWVKL